MSYETYLIFPPVSPFERRISRYPEDFIGGMHRHFQIVGELLRYVHFYVALNFKLPGGS